MRSKLLKIRIALAVLAALPILAAAPMASASHQNGMQCTDFTLTCGHWGNRYSPPVYTNLATWQTLDGGASVFDLVQDAGYFWQDNGFVQGWNPGAFPAQGGGNCTGPAAGNSFIDGAIHVCFVSRYDSHLYVDGQYRVENTYATRFGRCDNACNHIYAATIYIASDALPPVRQYALRHGFGHALGLGHEGACGVMYSSFCSTSATQDDRDSMWWEYGSHISG